MADACQLSAVSRIPRTSRSGVSPTSEAARAPSARKVPYGSAYFIPPRRAAITRSPIERAAHRREHERHQHQLPSEECADHRQHLDVTAAHPFMPRIAVVAFADQPEDSAANQHPDAGRRRCRAEDRLAMKADDDSGQRDRRPAAGGAPDRSRTVPTIAHANTSRGRRASGVHPNTAPCTRKSDERDELERSDSGSKSARDTGGSGRRAMRSWQAACCRTIADVAAVRDSANGGMHERLAERQPVDTQTFRKLPTDRPRIDRTARCRASDTHRSCPGSAGIGNNGD